MIKHTKQSKGRAVWGLILNGLTLTFIVCTTGLMYKYQKFWIGIGIGTSSTATYRANAPAVATAARVKEAINKAITANPGGVKSTAVLPQDSLVNAAYAFGNTLYFKSFSIA